MRALVHQFGESFRQAVRQSLGHQGVVVVIVFLKLFDQGFDMKARGDRERAQIIQLAAFTRCNKIAHRVVWFLIAFHLLLPQGVKRREQMARFIRVDFDIFLDAVGRKESDHGARFEQFFAHDLVEQLLAVVE